MALEKKIKVIEEGDEAMIIDFKGKIIKARDET